MPHTAALGRNRGTNIGIDFGYSKGKEKVGQIERVALKHTHYHM